MTAGLTPAEDEAVSLLGRAYQIIEADICGHGPTREADLAEITALIHAVQYRIIAQGQARGRPGLYRTLGGAIAPEEGRTS